MIIRSNAAVCGTIIFSNVKRLIDYMNTTSKVITGFLIGTVIGAITGLLVAPATGKKTRKNIEKKTKKMAKQVAGYVGISNKPQRVSSHAKNGKASIGA
jgi:gas vesicle protein